MDLPSGVLSVEGSVVGAATCIVLVPKTNDLLAEHSLAFSADRPYAQRLIALDFKGTSKVFSFLIRAKDQRVKLLRLQLDPHMARLRLIWLLKQSQMSHSQQTLTLFCSRLTTVSSLIVDTL